MAVWYFAYGSNLDFVQMRSRCPSAQYICRAVLKDHAIEFTRPSVSRKGGVADLIQEKGHDAWGVIYLLEDRDLSALDAAEGYQADREPERNAYNRKDGVRVLAENDKHQIMRVSIYFAVRLPNAPRPSEAYMRQIIDGAKFWKLPIQYIEELQQVRTLEEDR
jgi:cation transport regulator ChaC